MSALYKHATGTADHFRVYNASTGEQVNKLYREGALKDNWIMSYAEDPNNPDCIFMTLSKFRSISVASVNCITGDIKTIYQNATSAFYGGYFYYAPRTDTMHLSLANEDEGLDIVYRFKTSEKPKFNETEVKSQPTNTIESYDAISLVEDYLVRVSNLSHQEVMFTAVGEQTYTAKYRNEKSQEYLKIIDASFIEETKTFVCI